MYGSIKMGHSYIENGKMFTYCQKCNMQFSFDYYFSINNIKKHYSLNKISDKNNIEELIKVDLTKNQLDALISLASEIGYANFRESTLLKKLNENINHAELEYHWKVFCVTTNKNNEKTGDVEMFNRRCWEWNIFIRG